MKLWWPHCEAMVALLWAYKLTKDEQYLARFTQASSHACAHVGSNKLSILIQVTDYALRVFARRDDEKSVPRGWYGYADRQVGAAAPGPRDSDQRRGSQGTLTHTFCGAAYKGFFHVPRGLLFCVELIDEIVGDGAK
jgi:hypothetical protein